MTHVGFFWNNNGIYMNKVYKTNVYCLLLSLWFKASCGPFKCTIFGPRFYIEGFHDAVRTPYALRPGRHVGFFWNNKICFNFVSILFEKIKLTVSEHTYIIVPMV